MEKILLTGGDGFLASRIKKVYRKEYEILSTNRKSLDITNDLEVRKVIGKFKPNYVIHTAAIAETAFCNENPEIAYKINVEGALNIARACKENSANTKFRNLKHNKV